MHKVILESSAHGPSSGDRQSVYVRYIGVIDEETKQMEMDTCLHKRLWRTQWQALQIATVAKDYSSLARKNDLSTRFPTRASAVGGQTLVFFCSIVSLC